MGHAVGLSPLVVLISVVSVGYLLGPIYVLIATPLAAVAATVVDVVVRGRDPAEEDAPSPCCSPAQPRASANASSGPAPAAEDQAAEREPESKRAEGKRADRGGLPSGREPLPAGERLALLVGQLLTPALLAQRAAGPHAEIEVVLKISEESSVTASNL